jgi:hypothetical protein
MVVPRVFISSTYYDLRHVRNAISEFIEYIGFQPVLSEQFDVFYEHGKSVQKSCLDEVKKCDMYILIIGTRYGSIFPNDTLSITHREYREAVQAKLPIFVFVDKYVYDDYRLCRRNKENPDVDASKIEYCNVQEIKVFQLISEVENRESDNAIICYDLIDEILDYLRKQLAKIFKEKALQPVTGEETTEEVIDLDKFESFANNLNIVGIPSVQISDIKSNDTFEDFLKTVADSIEDLGTDIRISKDGSIVNIGKDILYLLTKQYQIIKGGS